MATASVRPRSLCLMFAARRAGLAIQTPARGGVLTFNSTLAGYVRNLAEDRIAPNLNMDLRIDTVGRWAMSVLGYSNVHTDRAQARLRARAGRLGD